MRSKTHDKAQTRRLKRLMREARLPETYRRVEALAREANVPQVHETVAILTRARTIKSTRNNPDGWIFLDAFVHTLLEIAEGRLQLPPLADDA